MISRDGGFRPKHLPKASHILRDAREDVFDLLIAREPVLAGVE